MADRTGQQLGNYRLVRLLGRGGFAEVYLGEHIFLKTQAAIKVLLTQLSDEDMDGFLKESRTIASLNHPHIVRVLEFGIEENIPYLVMDLAPNGSLRQRYARHSRLEPSTVAVYLKQIAGGLQYAHEQKVIHRDVKPENLLLGKNGEVLVGDFGIALIGQSSRYQSTQNVVGTVAYMSPEQIQGKPRTASDQYSLAVVVYEWLAGERPFYGSFAELCAQHLYAVPPPLRQKVPGIPPMLEQVVMTALAKDPANRFPSIQAFATVFEQASQGMELQQPALLHVQSEQDDPTLAAGSASLASTLPASTGADALSSTLPAPTRVQFAMDTPAPTIADTLLASNTLATPVTPNPVPLPLPATLPVNPSLPAHPSPPSPHRKRMSMAAFGSIALALALVLVSVVALWSHLGAAGAGSAPGLTPGLTMTANGVVFVPSGTGGTTGLPVASPTGRPGVLPSGTARVFPTGTTPASTVTAGISPTVTTPPQPTVTVGTSPTTTTPPQPTVTLPPSPQPTVTLPPSPTAPPPSPTAPPPSPTTPPPSPTSPPPSPTPTFVPAMLSFSPSSFPNASGCSYVVGSGWTCIDTLSVNADATQNLYWNVSASSTDITFSSYGTTMSPGQSMPVTIFVPDRFCPVTEYFLFAATNQGNGVHVNWNCNAVLASYWGCSAITPGSQYQCTITPYMVSGGQGEMSWIATTASGALFQPTNGGVVTPNGSLTTVSVTTGCYDTFTIVGQGGSMGTGNTVTITWACQ